MIGPSEAKDLHPNPRAMISTINLTGPQRQVLTALATGEKLIRKGLVCRRLCAMGFVEYVPMEAGSPMSTPRITNAGLNAIEA